MTEYDIKKLLIENNRQLLSESSTVLQFNGIKGAIESMGGTILKLDNNKVYISILEGSELHTLPNAKALLKEALMHYWQFGLMWKIVDLNGNKIG